MQDTIILVEMKLDFFRYWIPLSIDFFTRYVLYQIIYKIKLPPLWKLINTEIIQFPLILIIVKNK